MRTSALLLAGLAALTSATPRRTSTRCTTSIHTTTSNSKQADPTQIDPYLTESTSACYPVTITQIVGEGYQTCAAQTTTVVLTETEMGTAGTSTWTVTEVDIINSTITQTVTGTPIGSCPAGPTETITETILTCLAGSTGIPETSTKSCPAVPTETVTATSMESWPADTTVTLIHTPTGCFSTVTNTAAPETETITLTATESCPAESTVTVVETYTASANPVTNTITETATAAPVTETITRTTITATDACPTETNTPRVPLKVPPFTYLGCYGSGFRDAVNNPGRFPYEEIYISPHQSLERCAGFCSEYTFFGVIRGDECQCGNARNPNSTDPIQRACSYVCPGNDAQLCGGSAHIQLYQQPL